MSAAVAQNPTAPWGEASLLNALMDLLRAPAPIMVSREEAARLCGMCVATYDKHVRNGLLPRMNATGRVTIEALKRACLRLDGVTDQDPFTDEAERSLQEWKRGRP